MPNIHPPVWGSFRWQVLSGPCLIYPLSVDLPNLRINWGFPMKVFSTNWAIRKLQIIQKEIHSQSSHQCRLLLGSYLIDCSSLIFAAEKAHGQPDYLQHPVWETGHCSASDPGGGGTGPAKISPGNVLVCLFGPDGFRIYFLSPFHSFLIFLINS